MDSNGFIHHNSLILAYIYKTLNENGKAQKQIVIVPNLNLITQFKNDWIDYGIEEEKIGEVWANKKEWDKDIVISTWQSLANYKDKLSMFDSVFCDECHSSKSNVLRDILSKTENAEYRIGCTGTMPDAEIDEMNVRAYLGPVIKDYSAKDLKEYGFIAPCTIHKIELNYKEKMPKPRGESSVQFYNEIKSKLFNSPFRLDVIRKEMNKIKDNVILLLVDKVESEGEILKNFIQSCPEYKDVEIVFINGKMKKDEREEWRQKAVKNKEKLIICATYQCFQQGINIPNLANVFLCTSGKSKIKILQSIGRTLRLFNTKDMAHVFDFIDIGYKWFEKHSDIRENYYNINGFEIETLQYYE